MERDAWKGKRRGGKGMKDPNRGISERKGGDPPRAPGMRRVRREVPQRRGTEEHGAKPPVLCGRWTLPPGRETLRARHPRDPLRHRVVSFRFPPPFPVPFPSIRLFAEARPDPIRIEIG